MTHAHDDCARFFGYEVHVLHENSTHDLRRRRGIHGSLGLRVPTQVLYAKRTRDMRRGQPKPLPQRTFDDASSSVAQYQAAWRGMVQYDRMAYHLHLLQHRTHVMEVSLGQTLAKKDNMTCHKISRRYGATIQTEDAKYSVPRWLVPLRSSRARHTAGPYRYGGTNGSVSTTPRPNRYGVDGAKGSNGSWLTPANSADHRSTWKCITCVSGLIWRLKDRTNHRPGSAGW